MTAKLAVIDGPGAGTEVELPSGEFVIGRDPASGLALAERLASRRHAVITGEAGIFTLVDLESRNGTFVNGIPVRERRLEHGDRIKIGSSLLVFLDRDTEPASSAGTVELEESSTFSDHAIRLQPEDAIYLRPGAALASFGGASRIAVAFDTLLAVGLAISSIRDVSMLASRLLELVFEVIPAERGAIVLTDRAGSGIAALFGWNRGVGAGRTVQVSKTVIRHVLSTGEAVLSDDVLQAASFGDAESLAVSGSGGLLVVPMVRSDRSLGVVYLSTGENAGRFDAEHLQLLTAVARLAAPVFENAQYVETLERENRRLVEEIALDHQMVGESPAMRSLYELIAKVAPRDSTVLILGESGTGKELVARTVHHNSGRARGPFVAVNCATLSENLLESELFGHERGAFTGAVAQRRGKLELANGGTIFLDEIGELALPLQAKLLRALQEREVERVGGSRPVPVDVRIVAATNRYLEGAVAAGTFRSDLYYRLNVVSVKVPPLREREGDVALLASYFAAKYAERCTRPVVGNAPDARAALTAHDWPGNVRELENTMERAVVLGETDRVTVADLPEALHRVALAGCEDGATAIPIFHAAVADFKENLIRTVVERTDGNLSEAARQLGLHRNYVSRLVKSMGIRNP
jgi:Nif-specific regulatory protein